MAGTSLVLALVALVIVSMDLALAIVWDKRSHYQWTPYAVVFTASLLGAAVFFIFDQYFSSVLSGTPREVLHYVWQGLLIADSVFMLVFMQFFVNWIIARPLSSMAKAMFFASGICYACLSIVNLLISASVLPLEYLLIGAVTTYLGVVMLKSRNTIEDKSVRHVSLVLFIISMATLPILVAGIIFVEITPIVIPLIGLAYMIAILVFLFVAMDRQMKHQIAHSDVKTKKELTLEDVEKYHITEREFEVVKLIKNGLTNKEIASELSISVNTVNNHIANIFSKVEVRSRIDLLNVLEEASW